VAEVSLAIRHPVSFHPQLRGGQDLHHWLVTTGFDLLPPQWLSHYLGGRWVIDTGKYQHAWTPASWAAAPCSPRSAAPRRLAARNTREG
jgi:putative flavoprotein involved in K+ transport